jgi:hypothetical protein
VDLHLSTCHLVISLCGGPPLQVAAIQQERTGTEGLVAELGSKCTALASWLDEHEYKLQALGEGDGASGASSSSKALDVNKVVVPADDLSRQALAALAEDLALEDALVVLDKALLQGKLAPEVYLKQVRVARVVCKHKISAQQNTTQYPISFNDAWICEAWHIYTCFAVGNWLAAAVVLASWYW